MAIVVTNAPTGAIPLIDGGARRMGTLNITGLVDGNSVIPHGLPFTPAELAFVPAGGPTSAWWEYQPPDASAIYLTVGAGGPTAGRILYWG